MNAVLTPLQIEYVLFHLGHHVELSPELRGRFYFASHTDETRSLSGKVVFLLSDQPFAEDKVIRHETIPILFPGLRTEIGFVDDRGNLVFCHDLLKSSFFLLSGYQEFMNPGSKDNLNRFAFSDSVQYHLNFIGKPVVNYYFDFIIRELERYCGKRSITVTRRRLFSNFGFILTHDIDKVDLYDVYYLGYKLKEILGLRKSRLKKSDDLKVLLKCLGHVLGFHRENPYWNFEYLRRVERERNFRSIFFFLDQGVKHSDAHHSFSEERMIHLFRYLEEENCEVALHGSVKSVDDPHVMADNLKALENASNANIVGNRQHRLLWKYPDTAEAEHTIGLKYDSTLGFAAHEGFRNSYCHPYKLWDFGREHPSEVWEFPLNVMDGTLFAYQRYTTSEAMEKCLGLMEDVAKFGGVFNLLWHNSFFDDLTYPGVTKFYEELLQNIFILKPENVLGSELLSKLDAHSPNS